MIAGGQADHWSKQDPGRQGGVGRRGSLLQDLTLRHGRGIAAELLGVDDLTLERYAGELPVDGDVPGDGELLVDDVLSTDDPVEVDEAALLRREVAALREEVAHYEERLEERFEERLARLERGGAGHDQAASATPQPLRPGPESIHR